ncbi:protein DETOXIFICATION 53-like [Senna tora]|uniref:Protein DETOXIFICATION n=1 Tax=Senna tora TaxID=362788 RepID=A0A834XHJ7_9FABA|nr:protein DETOXIFICATION 53-like [Senna tora]
MRSTWDLQRFSNILVQALSLSQVKEELQMQAKILTPIVFTSLLMYSRTTISMLFLGHQGKLQLAGGSLAIGFANITANSILKGLTMGMDSICAQAYGAQRWSLLSQTLLKTISLLLLVSIPISLLWLNITPILLWLGQDPQVTHIAQIYLLFSIPELLAQACLNPLRVFLRTQNLNFALTLSASVSSFLHLPLNYFLAVYLNLGVKGVALATGLNSLNMILGLLVYLLVSDKPIKPWEELGLGGGSSSFLLCVFQNWKPLLSLALPSCLSVCLEWWWYEIMLFLCGLLSNPQTTIATMGILIQTCGFLYVFPFSLSSALTIRIGHSLGAGEACGAQRAAIVGMVTAFTFGVTACVVLVSVRGFWGRMFTSERQIVELVRSTLPILGLGEIGNWPQTASCGILSGTSRPYVGARINLCAFYLIGLPVSLIASFVYGFGFEGLWYGMVAAQISCFCMMVYAFLRTDWRHHSRKTKMEMELALQVPNNLHKQEINNENDDEESKLIN